MFKVKVLKQFYDMGTPGAPLRKVDTTYDIADVDRLLFLIKEKRSVELMNLLVEVIALTDNKLAAEILLDEYKDEQLHEKIRHMEKERKLLLELRKWYYESNYITNERYN